ncbi:MAG: arginine repressor [Clostridiales bacterium]|nr:arginine repressor [Clostridiales bacterium]
MKKKRHQIILELIENNRITTQDQLQEMLKKQGFDVTQATVSRDIKELMLVKKLNSRGEYSYALPNRDKNDETKLKSIFSQSVIGVDYAGNIIVVKCYSGMANAACAAIDSNAQSYKSIVGTIAGDDSFFILCRTEKDALELINTIQNFIKE